MIQNSDKIFKNRSHAGRLLADKLLEYKNENPYVLALPRGGVILGLEIARVLNCPFSVLIVRKIGAPNNPEFGIGAISEHNSMYLDHHVIDSMGISVSQLKELIAKEERELNRRLSLYRKNKPLPDLKDKTIILVDDGLATGVTARAGINAIRKIRPKSLIFAVPVCSEITGNSLQNQVNSLLCLISPSGLNSIGAYYQDFSQVTDEEVINILNLKL